MCSFRPAPITTQRLILRGDPLTGAFTIETLEGEVVGEITFKPRGRFSELDCWIEPAHRGKGYASEAVPAALASASTNWGRKVVLSGHRQGADAPAAMLIKAGFLYTGDVELRPDPTRMMVWLA